MTRFYLLMALGLCLLAVPALAQSEPGIGDKIPHDLIAHDQNGEEQSFEAIKGQKGITLVFVRSADWCPYCQVQLNEYRDASGELEQLGYPVVSVSYDSVEKLQAFARKSDIEYTMLSDPASEIIKAFGILNDEHAIGTFAYGIPKPGVYIVSADGIIQAKLAEEGYKTRPTVEDIKAEIQKASSF
ncbi:MAG: peroxiredoxin family protein [Pseudomonadota bacterium]